MCLHDRQIRIGQAVENDVVSVRRSPNLHLVAAVEPRNCLYYDRDLGLQRRIGLYLARAGDYGYSPRFNVRAHGADVGQLFAYGRFKAIRSWASSSVRSGGTSACRSTRWRPFSSWAWML